MLLPGLQFGTHGCKGARQGILTLSPSCIAVQRMVSRLLRWHVEWLQEAGSLTDERAQWLFALAVLLEKPLQMGGAGMLRQLLRCCARLQHDGKQADAGRLHTLIAIAGAYFRQDERLSQVAKEAYQ